MLTISNRIEYYFMVMYLPTYYLPTYVQERTRICTTKTHYIYIIIKYFIERSTKQKESLVVPRLLLTANINVVVLFFMMVALRCPGEEGERLRYSGCCCSRALPLRRRNTRSNGRSRRSSCRTILNKVDTGTFRSMLEQKQVTLKVQQNYE